MNKNIGAIYWILVIGLIIRLFLSFLPAFESDQNAFRFWTARLVSLGPAHFYSTEVFTNNPVGIFYLFWLVGILKSILFPNLPFDSSIDPLLKFVANFADILAGLLIYRIIKAKLNEKLANLSAILYIFNPSLIFNSAIWGQYDGVAILFLVLTVYFCLIKKSPLFTSVFFALAWITKPQSLQLAPFLFFFFIRNFKSIQWLYALVLFVITTLLLFLPFFPENPVYGIYYVSTASINLFNCTTCNALNFWGILGNWQSDLNLFLGLPVLIWSFALLAGSLGLIFYFKKLKGNILYFTISISMLAFFMLLTRMHERYMSYFFPFLILSAVFLKSKILTGFYIFFSIIFFLNLYIPYAYYGNLAKITNLPVNYLFNNFSNLSFISFIGFILLFIYYVKYVKNYSSS